jgi:hypothetical protein
VSDEERVQRRRVWSQPAHKLQTRPPRQRSSLREMSMSHLVPLLEFNRDADHGVAARAIP